MVALENEGRRRGSVVGVRVSPRLMDQCDGGLSPIRPHCLYYVRGPPNRQPHNRSSARFPASTYETWPPESPDCRPALRRPKEVRLMKPAPKGWRYVFCKSFVHHISKKRVFRRNGGYFCFLVRA